MQLKEPKGFVDQKVYLNTVFICKSILKCKVPQIP